MKPVIISEHPKTCEISDNDDDVATMMSPEEQPLDGTTTDILVRRYHNNVHWICRSCPKYTFRTITSRSCITKYTTINII